MNSLKIAEKYSMVVGKLYQKDSQIYRRCKLVKFKIRACDSRTKN